MPVRFTVLASGSGGNASFLEADGFGLLLDAGLGPRTLANRLAAIGAAWPRVSAVLLTHTHSDHWKDRTLAQIRRLNAPFYCHAGHHSVLATYGPTFPEMCKADLVRGYEPGVDLWLTPKVRCRPLAVPHDSGPTFGFRIDGDGWSVGYVADLGTWNVGLAEALANVDVLAMEFNHDERLERTSSRPAHLIARVLSDHGHLSNAQAAALLTAVLERSRPGRVRHVIQLHLSRDCNRPILAQTAAQQVLKRLPHPPTLHTAQQDYATPQLSWEPHADPMPRPFTQPPLPWADAERS